MSPFRRFWDAAWRLKFWWMMPLALAVLMVLALMLMTGSSVDVPLRYPR